MPKRISILAAAAALLSALTAAAPAAASNGPGAPSPRSAPSHFTAGFAAIVLSGAAGRAVRSLTPASAGPESIARPDVARAVTSAAGSHTAAITGAGCSGYGCDGQWPDLSGCANSAMTPTGFAVRIMQGSATIGWIELRYSTVCHTAWARVTSYYNGGVKEMAAVTRLSDNQQYGCYSYNYSSSLGGYSCYTQMVYDGGEYARAFGVAPNWYGGTSSSYTHWY